MKRSLITSTIVALAAVASPVLADMASSVMSNNGYLILADEVGVSGLQSSYHGLTLSHVAYNNVPTLGPGRVNYPGGVGAVPSPGGNLGRPFDQGVLGYKLNGSNITFGLATGLNPAAWQVLGGAYGNTKHGQGDLFIDVLSDSGMSHYAFLNNINSNQALGHSGYFDPAKNFRYGSGPSVGELVRLSTENDIAKIGGNYGYVRGGNSPAGLDERVFAKGGTDMNVGTLNITSFLADEPLGNGSPMTFYLMEWTAPLSIFGTGPLTFALHSTATCGNDQIGAIFSTPTIQIPSPSALALGLIGFGWIGRVRRGIN